MHRLAEVSGFIASRPEVAAPRLRFADWLLDVQIYFCGVLHIAAGRRDGERVARGR